MSINLRELFTKGTKSIDELPDWIHSTNCIYSITNLINGKIYIGMTKYLYGRFISYRYFSHLESYIMYCKTNSTNRKLYSALRKYGCRNFEVSLIDSNVINLKEMEEFYINKFNSYINGYNMTLGSEDATQLHSTEVYESNRLNHGGKLAWNCDSVYELQKSKNNGVLPIHTKEAHVNSMKSQRINNGGLLAFNTIKAKENNRLSRLIYWMNKRLQNLEMHGLDLNLENYISYFGTNSLINISKSYESISKFSKWTPCMDKLINEFMNKFQESGSSKVTGSIPAVGSKYI